MPEIVIRKPTSTRMPRYWLFVDFNLTNYVCRYAELSGNEWRTIAEHDGKNDTFFALLTLLRNKDNVCIWVVGWRIYEFMCSSGIYSAIANEHITMTTGETNQHLATFNRPGKRLVGGLVCENPPTIVDAQLPSGQKVKFLDIRNWGISRQDIEHDDTLINIEPVAKAIGDYVAMLKVLNMGSMKQTAASQGYYCYRMAHMKHELVADNDDRARPVERQSYYAGRAECFRLGKIPGRIYHLDVKSMYSSIGEYEDFPTNLVDVSFNVPLRTLARHSGSYGMIAHVEIDTNAPVFPLRIDKRVIWPIGRFETYLAGPELVEALDTGCIVKVNRLCRYLMAPIFTSWSKWYFYAMQDLSGLGLLHLKQALKLAVNSMYGKIGQRSKIWKDSSQKDPRFPWEQWWGRNPRDKSVTQYRCVAGAIQYLDASEESPTSLPSISAYMSSYGRMMLWNLILTAGVENVYYCDTDGIMVNDSGYVRLLSHGRIKENSHGYLSVREEGCDVEIFGIKHYRFGERWCCSGVPDCNITRYNGKVTFEQHSPFNDGLWHRKAFEHEYKMIERSYKRDYKHGARNDDGSVSTFKVAMAVQTSEEKNGTTTTEWKPNIVGATRFFTS